VLYVFWHQGSPCNLGGQGRFIAQSKPTRCLSLFSVVVKMYG
jgi:hypothetical protein